MKFSVATLRTDLLMLACALAMTGVALALALTPSMLDRAPTVERQKLDLEARKKEADAINLQLIAARADLRDLAKKGEQVAHLQPASKINDRLLSVTDLAAQAHIAIAQMNPVATDTKAEPETGEARAEAVSRIIPIKLSGKGSYPAVSQFLHALHDKLTDTAVIGIHLEAVPDEHLPDAMTGSFTIDLAWHAALAGVAAPAGPSPKP